MGDMKMDKRVADFLADLINAGLKNEKISSVPAGITLVELLDIAARQSMKYLILNPLLGIKTLTEEERNIIKAYIMKAFMISSAQAREAKLLSSYFEEHHVKYQMLKGTIMKEMYPKPEYRDMSDIDMLIDLPELEKVDEALKENGYTLYKSIEHHDIYRKEPFITLEVHRYLTEDRQLDLEKKYFSENGGNKKISSKEYGYEFSLEDFYIFMIMHMARHFYERGCGVRGLVDIYVFNSKYHKVVDRSYITDQLQKYHLADFEFNMGRLAEIWLVTKKWNEFYSDVFDYMMEGNVYGKEENGIWSQFAREKQVSKNSIFSRLRLKLWYLFPSYEYMAHYNEWLVGKPYLLPVAWVNRAIHRSEKSKYRQNLTESADANQIYKMQRIYKKMNLQFND